MLSKNRTLERLSIGEEYFYNYPTSALMSENDLKMLTKAVRKNGIIFCIDGLQSSNVVLTKKYHNKLQKKLKYNLHKKVFLYISSLRGLFPQEIIYHIASFCFEMISIDKANFQRNQTKIF